MALKVIGDKAYVEQEARILSRMKHDNIVRIWYASDSIVKKDGEPVYSILMEYVDGKTLGEMMEDNPRGLSIEQAIALSAQLLDGIRYLRSSDVFHRDLNLNNIKIDSSGTLKILDFGIATQASTGKPKDNRRYGGSTDAFSWGLLTYKMITGRHLVVERDDRMGTQTYAERIRILKGVMREENGMIREEYANRIEQDVPQELQQPLMKALGYMNKRSEMREIDLISQHMDLLRVDPEKKKDLEETLGKEISNEDYFRIKRILAN
jgi:serine/threonine protein kinase